MSETAASTFASACADLEHGFTVRGLVRLRNAAAAGHPPAQLALAMHLLEAGTSRTEALSWLERSVATGLPAARYLRAALSYPSTAEAALEDLNAAAADGHPPAETALALAWHEHSGEEAEQIAAAWFWRARAHGSSTARALMAVSDIRAGTGARPAALTAWAGRPVCRFTCLHEQTPRIIRSDDVLSRAECAWLRLRARPSLRPSRVIDPASGRTKPDPVRTGTAGYFSPGRLEMPAVRLAERLAWCAGVPPEHAEPLAVLRYLGGQEYKPHRDGLGAAALAGDAFRLAGDRAATALAYLNQPAEGGATAFPLLGVSVRPRTGRVLIFDNLDESGNPAAASLHAGESVTRGSKWLASLWLRQRPLPLR